MLAKSIFSIALATTMLSSSFASEQQPNMSEEYACFDTYREWLEKDERNLIRGLIATGVSTTALVGSLLFPPAFVVTAPMFVGSVGGMMGYGFGSMKTGDQYSLLTQAMKETVYGREWGLNQMAAWQAAALTSRKRLEDVNRERVKNKLPRYKDHNEFFLDTYKNIDRSTLQSPVEILLERNQIVADYEVATEALLREAKSDLLCPEGKRLKRKQLKKVLSELLAD
jgi:hypothetical protein